MNITETPQDLSYLVEVEDILPSIRVVHNKGDAVDIFLINKDLHALQLVQLDSIVDDVVKLDFDYLGKTHSLYLKQRGGPRMAPTFPEGVEKIIISKGLYDQLRGFLDDPDPHATQWKLYLLDNEWKKPWSMSQCNKAAAVSDLSLIIRYQCSEALTSELKLITTKHTYLINLHKAQLSYLRIEVDPDLYALCLEIDVSDYPELGTDKLHVFFTPTSNLYPVFIPDEGSPFRLKNEQLTAVRVPVAVHKTICEALYRNDITTGFLDKVLSDLPQPTQKEPNITKSDNPALFILESKIDHRQLLVTKNDIDIIRYGKSDSDRELFVELKAVIASGLIIQAKKDMVCNDVRFLLETSSDQLWIAKYTPPGKTFLTEQLGDRYAAGLKASFIPLSPYSKETIVSETQTPATLSAIQTQLNKLKSNYAIQASRLLAVDIHNKLKGSHELTFDQAEDLLKRLVEIEHTFFGDLPEEAANLSSEVTTD